MTKLFHRLSTRIVLEILLAVAVSAAIYAGANAALTRFFQQYATEPAVFRRLSESRELITVSGKSVRLLMI